MCGIAGFIHRDRNRPASRAIIEHMTARLAHRGPDGRGHFVDSNVALGHARLSIIDLVTGGQPLISGNQDLVIVQNGEIYNYVELRESLCKRGHVFHTQSDTEVILEAYAEWGLDCVKEFNGMWAFALWDRKRQRLFCSRDRLGEKPFYYAYHEGTFVFASEPKAIFAYGFPKVPNWEVLDAYLCLTYVPAPQTFFRGMEKLRPATNLLVTEERRELSEYWNLHNSIQPDETLSRKAVVEEFDHLLRDSINLRLRSDVQIGAFLSGGLDSGCIVTLASEAVSRPLHTYTAGFADRAFDERGLARQVAHQCGTIHTDLEIDVRKDRLYSAEMARLFDEPFGDSSAIPSFLISEVAKRYTTVVLTGDGGDEVLSGYPVHQAERILSLLGGVGRMVFPSLKALLPADEHGLLPLFLQAPYRKLSRFVSSGSEDLAGRIELKQSGVPRESRALMLRDVSGYRPARDFIAESLKPVQDLPLFGQLEFWLLSIALPDDMLTKVDRASMANGIETRVPFLDHRIVELLCRVDAGTKFNGLRKKAILRDAVGWKLPSAIQHARKRGFVVSPTVLGEISGAVPGARLPQFIQGWSPMGTARMEKRQARGKENLTNAFWTIRVLEEVLLTC